MKILLLILILSFAAIAQSSLSELQILEKNLTEKVANLKKIYAPKHPEVVAAESQLQKVKDEIATIATNSSGSPTLIQRIDSLGKQLEQALVKLEQLLIKYTADHPDVKATEASIVRLQSAIKDLQGQLEKENAKSSSSALSKIETDLLVNIVTFRLGLASCGFVDESSCADLKRNLAESYRKAANYPAVMDILVGDALSKYDGLRTQTKSAAQVSQIADEQNAELMRIIVAQNTKIIELLQKILNKK